MNYIEDKNPWGRVDRFEVVDEWPIGYVVWNIGREYFPYKGYLPLCRVDADYMVDLATLKALNVCDEDVCLKVLKDAGLNTVDYERYKQIRDV